MATGVGGGGFGAGRMHVGVDNQNRALVESLRFGAKARQNNQRERR
jgi:hypothetical protein